jgi:hypothetical protein
MNKTLHPSLALKKLMCSKALALIALVKPASQPPSLLLVSLSVEQAWSLILYKIASFYLLDLNSSSNSALTLCPNSFSNLSNLILFYNSLSTNATIYSSLSLIYYFNDIYTSLISLSFF